MKLYRIYDRLLDHWFPPFAAPHEKDVLSSIAQTVNSRSSNEAITQAPHQFQIYETGKVEEDGTIKGGYTRLICDASSLLRGSVRSEPALHGDNTTTKMARTTPKGDGLLNNSPPNEGTREPTTAIPAPTEDKPAHKTNQ